MSVIEVNSITEHLICSVIEVFGYQKSGYQGIIVSQFDKQTKKLFGYQVIRLSRVRLLKMQFCHFDNRRSVIEVLLYKVL